MRGVPRDRRAISSAPPSSSGTFNSPADAIRADVACVASERLDENLAPAMSVLENLFPNPPLHGDSGLPPSRRRRERSAAMGLIQRFDVNPPAPAAEVQQLSGGNQQKVVLARWFHLNKPLVLLEEPTAGEYWFLGEPVHKFNERRRSEMYREYIGFVFQAYHLIDDLTVYENLETPLIYKKVPASERKSRIADLLDRDPARPLPGRLW